MDSRQSLSGIELFELYLEDKTNDHLNDPNNLKLLLNHALNNMEDKIDSNLEMEIVDFCIERLQKDTVLDESKIEYFRDKYDLIEKQQAKQRQFRKIGKMAAAAAVFVVIATGLFFGGDNEGKAGVFDWVSRLFVEENGEQLVIGTPDLTSNAIEIKEGHLPDKLPNNFTYIESNFMSSSLESIYSYHFTDRNDTPLIININEYPDSYAPTNNELEIHNQSYTKKETKNCTYYYSSNNNENYISWIYNNKIYTIHGEFDFDQLEEILSFYQKEQFTE